MASANSSQSSLFPTYARAELAFERGDGVWLETRDGRRFMDFAGGIAVSSLGHAHPHLVAALKDQAEKLWHTSNLFEIPGQLRLADRLCAASFADRVFFANSGAEAVEAAIKTARRYHYGQGESDRSTILTFSGAFHGRTIGTIAAGGQAKYLEGFGPKAGGFEQIEIDDEEGLKAALGRDETAAVLIEPIQGEGGVRPLSAAFLQRLRALCDENGVLLILDEVQTGIGRTGRFFAHEHAGIVPDILAAAKGIGGGFPLGACLATAEVADGMGPGTHGTTYGGNPLAMAVGNAVLDIVLEEGFLQSVEDRSLELKQSMASLIDRHPDIVEEVRGEGLLVGFRCKLANTKLVEALRGEGVLAAPAGDNVVRLLPPLNVSAEELREAMDRADRAMTKLSGANLRESA